MTRTSSIALAGCFLLAGIGAASAAFKDPLDVPAPAGVHAGRSPLVGIVDAGRRLVAVGGRGLVLVSGDGGTSWVQGAVPASTDLVAAAFPTPDQGWAVGHGGVVLHTGDGGRTWRKQLDGRQAAALTVAYYESHAPGTDPARQRALDEARRHAEEGATRPFLDVWFEDARVGYVIGTFNTMLKTTDGGKSWTPWSDRIDNDQSLHLHALRAFGGELYVAGEQGLLLKLDRQRDRFVALDSGYRGTFFGLAGDDRFVVAYGLRGNAYRSVDRGRTWSRLPTSVAASITSGTVLADGRLVLGTAAGDMLVSKDAGATFSRAVPAAMPLFGIAPAGQRVAAVGPAGVRVHGLK